MKHPAQVTIRKRLRWPLQVLGLAIAALACVATSKGVTHEPIYMSWKELRASVKVGPPRQPSKRGKIYVHGQLLLISEPGRGIHVIDNQNPADPQPRAFIRVPGNIDLAARGNHLYVDSAVDLLVFRLHADPQKIQLVRRLREVFPYQWHHVQPEGQGRFWPAHPDPAKGAVVGWRPIKKRSWL